uniref:Uncharacterized protein n=1 Tax=Helicotheca tamesis TaxID=374047 RepID=A0A7S2MYR7_9STRA|mmetsp:Transcript_6000/g.8213  ORF Transcript_6000/g.8213 Transcript_6000/m.8213 type:complete len:128 (+) Transcript_6000:275-658(+)
MFGMTGGAGAAPVPVTATNDQGGGAMQMAQMHQQMQNASASSSSIGVNHELDSSMRGDIRQRRGNFTFGLESELDQNMIDHSGGGGDATMTDNTGGDGSQEQQGMRGRIRNLGRRSLPGRFWRNDNS